MNSKEILGRNVKHFRLEKNYTQEKLSEVCNISARYISKIENGKRNVSLDMIDRLAESLDKETYELFIRLDKYKLKKRVDMK